MAYKMNALVVLATLWLTLFGLVTSYPTMDEVGDGSLSLPVTHNVNRTRNGPMEMYKAFRKFNIEIPDALQKIVRKQQANKVAANDGQ